jgi:hypothetical protein
VNSAQLRKIQNLKLDAIWRMAYLAARNGDVPAMRVLLEVCRRQATSLCPGLPLPPFGLPHHAPYAIRQLRVLL